jgi:ElaB/YqjD/DUF883 family membrane-anchored ribosome-binding protein
VTPGARIAEARARSFAAKAQLDRSVAQAKERLSPRSLANHAVDGVKTKAEQIAGDGAAVVKDRPAVAMAAAGVAVLLIVRRPMLRWWRLRRDKETEPATAG